MKDKLMLHLIVRDFIKKFRDEKVGEIVMIEWINLQNKIRLWHQQEVLALIKTMNCVAKGVVKNNENYIMETK